MRILAVDFGRKRVGLALSRSGSLVVPLAAVSLTTAAALRAHLTQLITDEQIERVIVGKGITQPALQQWLPLLDDLGVPSELVDENLTTKEAQQRLGTTQHHADSAAAAIILERYLEDLLQ